MWTRAIWIAVLACSANDDLPAPQISSVMPARATSGSIVTIAGSYFCHQPPTEDPLACANVGSLQFGSTIATTTLYTDSSVMAEVPAGSGTVQISITVAGRVSNAIQFTIE